MQRASLRTSIAIAFYLVTYTSWADSGGPLGEVICAVQTVQPGEDTGLFNVLEGVSSNGLARSWPRAVPLDACGRPLLGDGGQRLFYAGGCGRYPAESGPPTHQREQRTAAFDPSFMRDDATIGSFNQMLGTTGIYAIDVDGDELPEILVGHTMMWYLLEYEPGLQSYVQRYFHETGQGATFGGGGLVRVYPADIDNDGRKEIVTLLDDGTIGAYNAATGVLIGLFNLGRPSPQTMIAANLFGTGADEILVLWSDEIRVVSFGNPTPIWVMSTQGALDLAAGQMDSDPAIEVAIATGTGTPGLVFDADQMSVQMSYLTGFGERIATGDVDGDGLDEVIGAAGGTRQVMVVDVDTQLQKWSITNFDTSAICARDTDGDGSAEVLMGDGQWGDVHVLDGLTGFERRAFPNPESGVSAIDLADVDGDCDLEVLWGAGFYSTGIDRLYVTDFTSRFVEWQNLENDGPMHSFAVADVNADGRVDVLRACGESDAGYDGALVMVSDLHHRRDIYIPTATTNDSSMLTQGMAVANIDSDPALEYVMNDGSFGDGEVGAFDGITHQRQWTSQSFHGEWINSVTVGDPDRDGQIDFLIGTVRMSSGAQDAFLRILRGNDGTLLWASPALPTDWNGVGDIRVFDVDNDGVNEIVFIKLGEWLRVLDGVTHAQEWFLPGSWTALDVGQLDGVGAPEILLGDDTGHLTGYDGISHSQQFLRTVGSGRVEAVRIADVDRDNIKEILLTLGRPPANGELQVRDVTGQTLLWLSPALVGSPGRASSLFVTDVDDDGQVEVAVSTSYALRFFEFAGPVDSTPPVFAGTAGLTSAAQSFSGTCCNAVDLAWPEADDEASPPVEYRVYRSTTPGFTPGAATFLAQTDLPTYRDVRAVSGLTYHYVARAVDRFANEDGNMVERSVGVIGTSDPLPPDQGNVLRAARIGADVSIDFTGAPATIWRVFRDRSKTTIGTTPRHPDLAQPTMVDVGEIAAVNDDYYVVRGVSPCRNVGP